MSCFLVPATEAVIVTVATKILFAHENKLLQRYKREEDNRPKVHMDVKIPFSKKLNRLSNLLWGGSFLLAFEHVWRGEITLWSPFFTAAINPADMSVMLHEISTVGVTMAALVTVVWTGMLIVSDLISKKSSQPILASR